MSSIAANDSAADRKFKPGFGVTSELGWGERFRRVPVGGFSSGLHGRAKSPQEVNGIEDAYAESSR